VSCRDPRRILLKLADVTPSTISDKAELILRLKLLGLELLRRLSPLNARAKGSLNGLSLLIAGAGVVGVLAVGERLLSLFPMFPGTMSSNPLPKLELWRGEFLGWPKSEKGPGLMFRFKDSGSLVRALRIARGLTAA